MEGIGSSRTGRPSSRYGSAPVFTGPVRKWQKQWVHVSQSSSPSLTYNNKNDNNVSAVRIRRWTPVPPVEDAGELSPEERPRRKLRYAPIVVLEGKKKEAEKGDVDDKEISKTNQSTAQKTTDNDDNNKKSPSNVLAAKAQASEKSVTTGDLNSQPMDLDMGDDEDHDLGGVNKVADWVKAAQRGFTH